MSLREHKMSEEFKPIRITLSPEAFDRLERIMKDGSFRSYSSTIEECVRVVYELMNDISNIIGREGEPAEDFTQAKAFQAFVIIATRMARFTNRAVFVKEKTEK